MEYEELMAEIKKLVLANNLPDLKKLQLEYSQFARAIVDGGSDYMSAPLNVLVETILNYYESGFSQYGAMIEFLIENGSNTVGLIFQVHEGAYGMDVSSLIDFLIELGVPAGDSFVGDGSVALSHEIAELLGDTGDLHASAAGFLS